jgi:hypothetical protein
VFTGLILLVMLHWWLDADEPGGWRWLLLLGVLFGLDFSVHRTNALLIPGVIAWIAIRRPRTLRHARSIVASGAGLAAGLAVQLLVIPISRNTSSPINFYQPDTWGRFWSYVSLENAGGGFLVDLWPRKSEFWSVQVMDLIRIFDDNFLHWSTNASLLGILPAMMAVVGFVSLFRRARSLATAWLALLVLTAASTIVYFNIPADFFRPFDRHYLPVFVMTGAVIALGTSIAAEQVLALGRRTRALAYAGALIIALVPVAQLAGNWAAHDASRRHFTEDFARNSLESLPPNAIYFTVGDNDTFPAMYLQGAEGVRSDVRIMNTGLSILDWYVKQAERGDGADLATLSVGDRLTNGQGKHDTTLAIPIAGGGDTARMRLRPSWGSTFPPDNLAIMDIVTTNQWRRPVTFATTAGTLATWLPNSRLEGLYWRVTPTALARDDSTILRDNLMSKYLYRGYADASVRLDFEARGMGFAYMNAFRHLIEHEHAAGSLEACRAALERFRSAFPSERLGFGEAVGDLSESCR